VRISEDIKETGIYPKLPIHDLSEFIRSNRPPQVKQALAELNVSQLTIRDSRELRYKFTGFIQQMDSNHELLGVAGLKLNTLGQSVYLEGATATGCHHLD